MGTSDRSLSARTRLGAIAASSATATGDREAGDDRHWWDDTEQWGSTTPWDDQGAEPHPHPDRESWPDRIRSARWDVGRRGTAALAATGVLAATVALVVVWLDRPVPEAVPPLPAVEVVTSTTRDDMSVEAPAELVVSVVGLVARPGLVHLEPGARVADALDAAGGSVDGADLLGLNLARKVADGDQIIVGTAPPQAIPQGSLISDGAPGEGGPGAVGGGLLNLNVVDEAALDALPGVGPVTAAAIIAWRSAHGPFTAVEQLGEVDGIGPARLARLRDLVTV